MNSFHLCTQVMIIMFCFLYAFRMMMRTQNHLQRRKFLKNLQAARTRKKRKPKTKEETRRRTKIKKKKRIKANQVILDCSYFKTYYFWHGTTFEWFKTSCSQDQTLNGYEKLM